MKIILIHLPLPRLINPNAQTPIGIMYLASIIRKKHEVEIKNYASKMTHEAIADLPEADFYGITATLTQLPQVNRFCYLIKEKYRHAVIGVGGPGTNLPEYINWDVVDTICIGEGEEVILKMLEDIKNSSLQRQYRGLEVQDLDSLPYPARNLLDFDKSPFAFTNNTPISTGIITSRGCPFSCDFCASPKFNIRMRYRSAKSVYDEFKYIRDKYGIKQFRVIDDIFTLNKSRVLEICEMLKELDISYRVMGRVDTFDADIAKALHSSGCKEVELGVENFDDVVLKLLNKRISAADSVKALQIANDCGLNSRILMMIRTPGQSQKTVPTNITFLQKVPFHMIACGYFIPIPGSKIWYNPEAYGIEIIDRNIEHYDFLPKNRFGEKPRDIFKIKGREIEEVHKETEEFFVYLRETGKLHGG